ncbi:MAG: efflux RND transporter periplasmic adaptor subunit [Magnetococcales bacterium]|nr:efflux RND transporter periplasmic adaptor subunit [Magnetococcales bacterium]
MNRTLSLYLICLTTLSGLSGCREEKTVQPASKPVPVITVQAAPLHTKRVLLGTVQARYETEMAFRTGGKMIARLVEVGDTVKAGQPLARLDPADHELALQAAEDQWRAASVDATQAAVDEARLRRLLSDRSVADADHQRQKAKADAAAAQQAQARRQRELASHQLQYTTLQADRDGVITAIRFESGQVVSEGTPLLTLASAEGWEMVVDLPESLVGQVERWQATARFWPSNVPETPLTLREVAAQANLPARTFRSRFRLPQEASLRQAGLRLGMSATVHLTLSEASPAIRLPTTALLQSHDKPFVWLLHGQQLQQRPVEIHRQESDHVWVEGVQVGEQVVVAGGQKWDASMPVRAMPMDGAASGKRNGTP